MRLRTACCCISNRNASFIVTLMHVLTVGGILAQVPFLLDQIIFVLTAALSAISLAATGFVLMLGIVLKKTALLTFWLYAFPAVNLVLTVWFNFSVIMSISLEETVKVVVAFVVFIPLIVLLPVSGWYFRKYTISRFPQIWYFFIVFFARAELRCQPSSPRIKWKQPEGSEKIFAKQKKQKSSKKGRTKPSHSILSHESRLSVPPQTPATNRKNLKVEKLTKERRVTPIGGREQK